MKSDPVPVRCVSCYGVGVCGFWCFGPYHTHPWSGRFAAVFVPVSWRDPCSGVFALQDVFVFLQMWQAD